MKSARRLISTGKLLLTVAGLICWLLVLSTGLYAQICTPGAQGTNAVYNSTCYTGGKSWPFTILYNLKGSPDADHPMAPLIFDRTGKLYSTTEWGGTGQCQGGCGTVFKVSP